MIITLTGSNRFALFAALNKITADFVAKHGEFAVEKVDSEEVEYERLTDALLAPPFLAAKRLVVLRSPSFHKAFTEDFESLIKRVPDETIVIIFEPKIDKRSTYFKTLQKQTDFKEFKELDENSLRKWLVDFAKKQGGSISFGEASHLVNRVGSNQQLLANEVDKLINYQPEITRTSIDLLTEPTPQTTVFELLDAAMAGQTKRAMEIYDEQRLQKVEPQMIVGMIAWQLHVLAVVKSAGTRAAEEIASESKLNPFVVRKTMSLAKNLDMQRVRELVTEALKLDVRLKSESIDADEAIKNYLMKLAE